MLTDTEKVRRLCSWCDMCVISFSPWLFNRATTYTVVGDVTIKYQPNDGNDILEKIQERLGTRIETDKARYEPWERESGFKFAWESLILNITEYNGMIQAYFTDDQKCRSKYTFIISENDAGPEYTPSDHEIPWLLCMS